MLKNERLRFSPHFFSAAMLGRDLIRLSETELLSLVCELYINHHSIYITFHVSGSSFVSGLSGFYMVLEAL